MIDLQRQQRSFGDGFVAEAVEDLVEPWMRHADALLDDDALLTAVYDALVKRHPQSRTRGRRGAPAAMVVRLLVLKHVRNWSYATLEREVRANLVYRYFTRIGGWSNSPVITPWWRDACCVWIRRWWRPIFTIRRIAACWAMACGC